MNADVFIELCVCRHALQSTLEGYRTSRVACEQYLSANLHLRILTVADFHELPAPVRAEVEKFFGTTTGLTVMKGIEYGETTFEIRGKKDGRTVEVTCDPAGKRIE
ncbi:MAG: hypothetical protein QHJ82_04675 [Verrucomicrobiota bacterium]|nr:hypothetical protein [Verrucomicrobiota bacterium]